MNTKETERDRCRGAWLLAAAGGAVWLQIFLALVPVWRFGEYYEYGWLVPPVAGFFLWRRWQSGMIPMKPQGGAGMSAWFWVPGAILLAGILFAFRVVELGNLVWRPPLIMHALCGAAGVHFLVGWLAGGKGSLAIFPVTCFALTAVPYPGRMEEHLIQSLTGRVLQVTQEIFLLNGRPVEISGDKLVCLGDAVAVTEGCSGIRSLQSLLMAGMFFGEFLLLSLTRRLALLGMAVACAVFVNTGRAWWLASLQFREGEAAMHEAHDRVGHMAFVISAAVLFASGVLLRRIGQTSKVRRRVVGTAP